MGLLRGPPTANGRPGIHHVWARLFKDLYPASTPCGAATWPARAVGTATACRSRSRSRRSSGSRRQARDRGLRHRGVQPAVPRLGATPRRRGRRSRPASACGSTPTTPTGPSTTATSRACGGCSARCGTPATSTRATRSCRTAGAAAPRCRATSSASRARTATSPSRRCTCASGGRPRLRPPRVDHHAVDARLERRRRRRSRHRVRPGPRPADGGRDLVLAAWRVADVLGDDVEIVDALAADELVGLHYERPFDYLPLRPDGDADAAAWRVVADEFVTIDDGSGHRAPRAGVR